MRAYFSNSELTGLYFQEETMGGKRYFWELWSYAMHGLRKARVDNDLCAYEYFYSTLQRARRGIRQATW